MFQLRMVYYITISLVIIYILLYIMKFEGFTQYNEDEELCKDLYEKGINKDILYISKFIIPR